LWEFDQMGRFMSMLAIALDPAAVVVAVDPGKVMNSIRTPAAIQGSGISMATIGPSTEPGRLRRRRLRDYKTGWVERLSSDRWCLWASC
jgi:hypothetical protein